MITRLFIVGIITLTFGISFAEAAKRVALVIGNDSYKSLPNLNNARTDARGMAAKLKELGWNVILKQNASRRDISRSLAEFEGRLQAAEVGLVFYAGHGIQSNGSNYLVPSNAEIEVEEDLRLEGVEADQFLEAMERAGAPLNIVILDACRDNPLPKRSRSGSRGLNIQAVPKGIKGTAIVYSAAPGQVAQDGPKGGHGVFTGELLKVLDRPGLKLEEVFKETATKVAAATNGNQDPWINSSLKGDFYFRDAKATLKITGKTTERSKQDTLLWEAVKDSNNAEMFKAYLQEFPKGTFANIARIKLRHLQKAPSIEQTKSKARKKAEAALKAKIAASQKEIAKQKRLAAEERARLLGEKKALKREVAEQKRLAELNRKKLQKAPNKEKHTASLSPETVQSKEQTSKNRNHFKPNILEPHDSFDGIWKGKTECNKGGQDEEITDAKIVVKEGRFNNANDIFGRDGSISGSVSKGGAANIKGFVDFETFGQRSVLESFEINFRGSIKEEKLTLKGNQGPFLDCRVSLKYAGKASSPKTVQSKEQTSKNRNHFKPNILEPHDGFDGIWKGKTECNKGGHDEEITEAKIVVKEGRFNDANDVFGRDGTIIGSISKDGKTNIDGTVNVKEHASYWYSYPVNFKGELRTGKLILEGNQGPFLDCRVSLKYAGKASE